MPEDMPGRMPEDMPDRMPEGMPDRMPEDLPVRKCINVMVGITRSKVILMHCLGCQTRVIYENLGVIATGVLQVICLAGGCRRKNSCNWQLRRKELFTGLKGVKLSPLQHDGNSPQMGISMGYIMIYNDMYMYIYITSNMICMISV